MTKYLKVAISTIAFLAGYTSAIAQIGSNFNVNAEGWTTPNDADGTISYSATGGNPGGHVFGTPFVFVGGAGTFYFNFYFVAPSAFLGNRSAYYNGTLRYDIQQSSTGSPNQYAEVTIASSAGMVLYYFPPTSNQPPAPPSWATYSVALNNSLGYWKTTNSVSGTAATEIQIQNILSDLGSLQIRGLYRDANTTNRLDNVTLVPPILITTQPSGSTVCEGTVTTMTTAATNNPSISYQWQRETSPTVWGDISNTGGYSGVTTNTLAINTTGNFGAGNYRCRISGTAANDVFTSSATITINPLPSAPGTTGNSSCGPAAITLNASGGSAGQYRWYTVPTLGAPIAGQTNSTYTTPVISGTTTYYVSINNGTCESARTPVVATINTIPSPPGTTGNSACGPSAVTLNASGGSSGQYRWYTVPTLGAPIAGQTNSTYTTPVISGTTTYYVSINNGTCESTRTSVVATINTVPAAPGATGNSACGPSAVTLNAFGGSPGQYRWYTVPTLGTPIAGQTFSSYTTPVLALTTTYYVSINNGTCESTRTSVTATINTIPAAPGTTGNAACGPAAITLNASGGSPGQYRWYTVPTLGTPIAGQTNSTYTTPVIVGTTTYYVSINNGTCESTRTSVVATINSIPAPPGATGNAACGPSAVTLNAFGGSAGQYRWYTVPTLGTPIAGQTNSTYTTPVISGTTTYYVSINNGTCESTRTSVVATINTVPAAPGATGNAACGPSAITLNASGGSAGQYRWYTVPTLGTPIAGQTNSTYTTPVISGTTTYYVSINNGTCESTRTSVVATINTIPAAPGATGTAACGPSAVTLNASGGSAGQYRWYTMPTLGTPIAGQTNSTYTTPVISGTTIYYVSINDGACESTRTSVSATIIPLPAPPSTTGASKCGPGQVTLNAAGGTNGQYRWYTQPTGGSSLPGEQDDSYTTAALNSSASFYVAINDGNCESNRIQVTATINPIPGAPATTGAASCEPTAITLTASGGTSGSYTWYESSTATTPIPGASNATYTTPNLLVTTDYFVSINNGTCESARSIVTATIGGPSCTNGPPVVTPTTTSTSIAGVATIDLSNLISDPDGNLDFSTLKVTVPPASGAIAQISNGILTIDYFGLTFSGTESITIEVCDLLGSCTQQVLSIEVEGDVDIYNGISPNGDPLNDKWIIKNIEALPDTQSNKVSIYNRWGDLVFEVENYNNADRIFSGISKAGDVLASGVYFYKIEFPSGRKTQTGYLTLKH